MKRQKLTEDGFHIVGLALAVVVLAVVGFAVFKVVHSSNSSSQDDTEQQTRSSTGAQTNEPVKWAYNPDENKWFAQTGTVPKCEEPFRFDYTPVDLSQVNVISMPGSYRGYNYKPHGGFRIDGSPDGRIDVKMPTDATLIGLKRYFEGNPATLQYLLTFESDCGIAFRFDHLYTLTPEFQKIAETTPEPSTDTRSDPNAPFARTQFKAGNVIASAVGFPTNKNFGFDFGVYDYRSRNEISKNSQWATIHNQFQSLEWYGVCWLNMLPEEDVVRANQLALVVLNPAKPKIVSDYCSSAPYRTLDINGGQPTDG